MSAARVEARTEVQHLPSWMITTDRLRLYDLRKPRVVSYYCTTAATAAAVVCYIDIPIFQILFCEVGTHGKKERTARVLSEMSSRPHALIIVRQLIRNQLNNAQGRFVTTP